MPAHNGTVESLCIAYIGDGYNYNDARSQCAAQGAHVLTAKTEAKNKWIASYIEHLYLWLGLTYSPAYGDGTNPLAYR